MENKPTEKINCYIKLHNNKIVIRESYVQYIGTKPFLVHDGTGTGHKYFKFAFTYDEMVKKFVTYYHKKRFQIIKDGYLNFIENKTIGTKIYVKDINNKTDDYVECVWDGERFRCGKHLFYSIDDLLNQYPLFFEKPIDKNIITDWIYKGYEWNDIIKSWIKKT